MTGFSFTSLFYCGMLIGQDYLLPDSVLLWYVDLAVVFRSLNNHCSYAV